jgi:uncharacterized protein (TIGR00369 family)
MRRVVFTPEDGVGIGDAFSRFLGLRWDEPDVVRLPIRPDMVNNGGMLTGAVGFALLDYGMTSVLWRHTEEDERIATIGIAITYLRSATEGEVVCRSRLDSRTRRLAALSSQAHHEDGRLLMTATGTFAIRPA